MDFFSRISKLFIIIIVLLFSFNCNSQERAKEKKENLQTVIYSRYGGKPGFNETLTITKDSLKYFSQTRKVVRKAATSGKTISNILLENKYGETTSDILWKNINNSFNLELFKSIENGESRLPVDGTDTQYTVILDSGEKFSIINGQHTEQYKKMIPFFNHIDSLRAKIEKSVTKNE
jgi:hypothetical protein